MSSFPSGSRKNIQAFSSPSSSCRAKLDTKAPVNDTEDVVLSKDCTARLKATITWGRSSSPLWRDDWNGLAGNVAVNCAGLAATAPVAALVRDSSWPASSVKLTRTLMALLSSPSVRV